MPIVIKATTLIKSLLTTNIENAITVLRAVLTTCHCLMAMELRL